MSPFIHFALFLATCVNFAYAQRPGATIENLSVHHAKEDDEDMSSDFPVVHSGNPTSDAKINNFLQTRFFGSPLDEKVKLNVRQNFSPRGDQVFSYNTQITDRYISITIKQHMLNNSMSLSGYDQTFPFLFDPRSGQQFSSLAWFSEEGTLLFLGRAYHGFRDSYNQTMDRYLEGFSKLKAASQAEKCDCDCESTLNDVFRNGLVIFSLSKDSIDLKMDGCSWQNPGPHDVYSCSLSMSDVRPWLSDFGNYMINGGPEASLSPSPFMMFQGTLGSNISTTFVLRRQPNDELAGYEIYNRFGTTIQLRGVVRGSQFTFDELTPEGKSAATFKATFDGTKMIGTWTKSDGSRNLPFSAIGY